ncbi:MAG: 16S rRNA (cytidine(1402)-2'-O)-methyltransferase [Candidatus Latescibacter sp.]|nr:16S rRNA (cytidine(1402)-2'-O)-methyltransferase [Candidatus Latescibacter sp.]
MLEITPGSLFIVSTPIGNMGDLSTRALEHLRSVELVVCEDTRHTGLFLSRLEIKQRLVSYHDQNERSRTSLIMKTLAEGSDVALVSDAGTPGISDPAYRIVHAAACAGYAVFSIPGPSAVLAALVVSGLPLDRFVFEGFLPPRGMKRVKSIEALKDEPRTIVLYESPHRISNLLEQVHSIMGDRAISVSREITKLHEETIRGRVSEVLAHLKERKPRGEYTVVINGIGKRGRHEGSSDNI